MFLRRNKKPKKDEAYEYWTLVESIRTLQCPRQRIVATIGKLPGMDQEERIGWEEIGRILDGKPKTGPDLFEKEETIPQWATVNLKGVSKDKLCEHLQERYGELFSSGFDFLLEVTAVTAVRTAPRFASDLSLPPKDSPWLLKSLMETGSRSPLFKRSWT